MAISVGQDVAVSARRHVVGVRGHGFAGDPQQRVIGVANFHVAVVAGEQGFAVQQRVFQGHCLFRVRAVDSVVETLQDLGGLQHGFAGKGTGQLSVGVVGGGGPAVEGDGLLLAPAMLQGVARLVEGEVGAVLQRVLLVALDLQQGLFGQHQPGVLGSALDGRHQVVAVARAQHRGTLFPIGGRGHGLLVQVADKTVRVRRALPGDACGREVAVALLDAIGLGLFRQVAVGVVGREHALGAPCPPFEAPAAFDTSGQLALRILVAERLLEFVIGVIGGEDLMNVLALGGFFFADQVKAVEGALDAAHRHPVGIVGFGGAVLIAPGGFVEVVQPIVIPADRGVVTQEVVAAAGQFAVVIGVMHLEHRLLETGANLVFPDPGQGGARIARKTVADAGVYNGFVAAYRGLDLGDAQQAIDLLVGEPPGRVGGGQDHFIHLVARAAVAQFHLKPRQAPARRPVRAQQDFHGAGGQVDLQQGAALGIGHRVQPADAVVERQVPQADLVAFDAVNALRQEEVAFAPQYFNDPGFVHDPIAVRRIPMEVEALDFLLGHEQAGGIGAAGTGDFEGFPGGQGDHLFIGVVLRQSQFPAHAKPAVAGIVRVETQAGGHDRAAEVIGFDFRQGEVDGVLAGAGVDTGLHETEEVEGVGVDRGLGAHG
ncbi:hypothetical protein D3C86_993550 [compost metagenome]